MMRREQFSAAYHAESGEGRSAFRFADIGKAEEGRRPVAGTVVKEGVQGMPLRQGEVHPCVSFSARNAVFPFLGRKDTSPGRTPCRRSVTVRCIHPGCRAGAVEERSHPPGRTLPPGEYAHRRKTETENPVSGCPSDGQGLSGPPAARRNADFSSVFFRGRES